MEKVLGLETRETNLELLGDRRFSLRNMAAEDPTRGEGIV